MDLGCIYLEASDASGGYIASINYYSDADFEDGIGTTILEALENFIDKNKGKLE